MAVGSVDGSDLAPLVADADDVPAPRRMPTAVRYGSRPLVALGLLLALEQGEKQSLSIALPGIKEAFGVSDSALGVLPLLMSVVGLAAVIPFGILADRGRRTLLLAGAAVVWTAGIGLNGLALTFGMLMLARIGLGAVEANSPAALSLLSDYYPVATRARKLSLYQLGALGGSLFALAGGALAVGIGGWRWAFLMWVPLGLVTIVVLARLPEPRRGDQDADFGADLAEQASGLGVERLASMVSLPDPVRVGSCDYATMGNRAVVRELLRIRSLWFGVIGLTVSSLMLNGLSFWGITYFVRVHGLSESQAPLFAAVLGLGAAAGIIGGGFVSDALLRRGYLDARVLVSSIGSVAASVVLIPAFLSTELWVSSVLLCIGAALLTLPVGPSEAMVNDVVVAPIRGRAATVRSIVRTLSNVGPFAIGLLADAVGLRLALAYFTPVLAVGGLLMLFATRSYGTDLAYVVAETRRIHDDLQEGAGQSPSK